MEQYTEKQQALFLDFYKACKSKGIDPQRSEADRQRALLLAEQNRDLVKLFGDRLDGAHVEAYRMGKEYETARTTARKEADQSAKIAEQRTVDEASAALERSIAQLRGRDKRLFFYQKWEEAADAELKAANDAYWSVFRSADAQIQAGQQKESSWGTLGGIAAGVTGSTAVGAAVAADTMRKNAGVQEHNEAVRQAVFESIRPMVDVTQNSLDLAKRKKEAIQKRTEAVRLQLTENRPVEELMDSLTIDTPQITFTKGNTMLIQATVRAKQDFTVAGSEAAVVDGSFLAEVYEGDRKIGEAHLNLPLAGADGTVNVMGHCLEAKPGGTYTVLILPQALWLIEKYKASPVQLSQSRPSREGGTQKVSYSIPNLKKWIPNYGKQYAWTDAAFRAVPWQTRLAERQQEAEAARRAEEDRKAAAKARARKNRKIACIVTPIVVAAVAGGVLLFNQISQSAAYDDALALAEAGSYDEAIAAFEALGDYKDSAEQINSTRYAQAQALVAEGKYGAAISIFDALGDYEDSQTLADEARLEERYQNAIALLADSTRADEAYEAFAALGDYKDAAAYLDDFAPVITSVTIDGEEHPYRYNEAGQVIDDGEHTYEYSEDGRTVIEDGTKTMQYDDQGQLIRQTGDGGLSNVSTFTYAYDADGAVTRRTEQCVTKDGDPFYESVTTYGYDGNGQLSKAVETQTFALDRKEGHSPSSVSTRVYSYDGDGNLASVSEESIVYNYSRWSDEVQENTYRSTTEYHYGWQYAPDSP